MAASQRVWINFDSVDKLQTIPGVSTKTAEAIIQFRQTAIITAQSLYEIPNLKLRAGAMEYIDFDMPSGWLSEGRDEGDRVSLENEKRRSESLKEELLQCVYEPF